MPKFSLKTNSDNLVDSGASVSPIQPCLLLKIVGNGQHKTTFWGSLDAFTKVLFQCHFPKWNNYFHWKMTFEFFISHKQHFSPTTKTMLFSTYLPSFFSLLPTPWLLDLNVFWLHWQGSYYTFHERDKILLNSDLFSLVPNGRFLRGRIQDGYVVSESLQQQSDPLATLLYTWLLTTHIFLLSIFGNHVLFCTLQPPEKVP